MMRTLCRRRIVLSFLSPLLYFFIVLETNAPPVDGTSPSCSNYAYANATDPATGTAACSVDVSNQCYYAGQLGSSCTRVKWFCPKPCDAYERAPMTCGDGRYTNNKNDTTPTSCPVKSNELPADKAWHQANITIEEPAGTNCRISTVDGIDVGPPYTISYQVSLISCASKSPCRFDLIFASGRHFVFVNVHKGSLDGAGIWQWNRYSDGTGGFASDVDLACEAAMGCPNLGGLLVSGPDFDKNGTFFGCIKLDDGSKNGILVKRDGRGVPACLTDGSGSCLALPEPCCDVLSSHSSVAGGTTSPAKWPVISCAGHDTAKEPAFSWCSSAGATSAQLVSYNSTLGDYNMDRFLGYNCTNQLPQLAGSELDPDASDWFVASQNSTTAYGSFDPKASRLYAVLRKAGNGSLVCLGIPVPFTYGTQSQTQCFQTLSDLGCATNLALTSPRNSRYVIINPNNYDVSQPPSAPAPRTNWTCVQVCSEKGNSIWARYSGVDGLVQCQGPSVDRCSWYSGSGCKQLAPGEPAPHPSLEVGHLCRKQDMLYGWCKRVAEVVLPWSGNGLGECSEGQGLTAASSTTTTSVAITRSSIATPTVVTTAVSMATTTSLTPAAPAAPPTAMASSSSRFSIPSAGFDSIGKGDWCFGSRAFLESVVLGLFFIVFC